MQSTLENVLTPMGVKEVYDSLIENTRRKMDLETEKLENRLRAEEAWNEALRTESIVPGKNDDIRSAQRREISPLEWEEIDRIDEELAVIDGNIRVDKLRQEYIDIMLRMEGK